VSALINRIIIIAISIVGLGIVLSLLSPLLFSYETKLRKNAAMALAINISASPHILGATIKGEPNDYCQKNGNHLVVPQEIEQISGNTYKPTSCKVATPTMPNKYCSIFWAFRDCLSVYVPEELYSLPEIRSAIEVAIARPCNSFSKGAEKPPFRDFDYEINRKMFKCSESITGNNYLVYVVLQSVSDEERVIEFPNSR
jgi:hypothetical protein